MAKKNKSPLDLDFYNELDWQRVCRVRSISAGWRNEWYYEDIDESVMFSPHKSWVYAITVDGKLFKIGETGNPLGILPKKFAYDNFKEWQPQHGTKCRLGRYRKGGDSDEIVRDQLLSETQDPNVLVEFWAYPCEETIEKSLVGGRELEIRLQRHKSLEKQLINLYIDLNQKYPAGNCGRY